MLKLQPVIGGRTNTPPTIPQWLSAQRLENLVAQRTYELEQTIARLRARQIELEEQANQDCLTGLANRRLLNDRFQCAVWRSKRSGNSFAVLVVDLDGFKRINDTYGHASGDAVLVEVAKRLTVTLRSTDTAARLGGDEFVLIVECLNASKATTLVGQKVQAAISQTIQLEGGETVSVGASVGQAMFPLDGVDLEQLLCKADESMYAKKKVGSPAISATKVEAGEPWVSLVK